MTLSTVVERGPLSDDEFEALSDFLDEHSPFDYDGLLGLLHAVALAPGLVPPSAWLPAVLPSELPHTAEPSADSAIGWVLRQYNEVVDALDHNQAILPDEDDLDSCESFAAGYAAGAELDPEWRGDSDRWTFASGMAYLGGRLDLLTASDVRDIEENLAPEPKELLAQHLSATIRATYDSFRRDRAIQPPSTAASSTNGRMTRVGRNDPCPCGSGKKYKRCCIVTTSGT